MPHLRAHFWINWDLGRVGHCQDGDSEASHSQLKKTMSPQKTVGHRGYIHLYLQSRTNRSRKSFYQLPQERLTHRLYVRCTLPSHLWLHFSLLGNSENNPPKTVQTHDRSNSVISTPSIWLSNERAGKNINFTQVVVCDSQWH